MKVALFSDLHGETVGLELALKDIEQEKCDVIYCLGDMIDDIPDAEIALDMVRQHRIPAVFGNHDLKHDVPLRDDSFAFIEGLPERITFGDAVLSHASPLNRAKIRNTDDALTVFREADFTFGFVGHTHFPFVYSYDGSGVEVHDHPFDRALELDGDRKYLICVGALGDQRTPRVPRQYTIYDTVNKTVRYKLLDS